MRVCRANNGDDGCPWGVAAADERPFFGGPIRCGSLVNLSRFAYTHSLTHSQARLRLNTTWPLCRLGRWLSSGYLYFFISSTATIAGRL